MQSHSLNTDRTAQLSAKLGGALLCGILSFGYSGFSASADEPNIARIQSLPEKPLEAAPQKLDLEDRFISAESFTVLGIDPIITGPVPRIKRS